MMIYLFVLVLVNCWLANSNPACKLVLGPFVSMLEIAVDNVLESLLSVETTVASSKMYPLSRTFIKKVYILCGLFKKMISVHYRSHLL